MLLLLPLDEGRKTGMARMAPGLPGVGEHPDAKSGLSCAFETVLSRGICILRKSHAAKTSTFSAPRGT